MMNTTRNWHYGLELMRVFFCFVVIVHHYMMLFTPDARQMLINDGNYAVFFFLLLSGYLIGSRGDSYRSGNGHKIGKSIRFVGKRYFRLLPVVAISISIASIIYFGGGIIHSNYLML